MDSPLLATLILLVLGFYTLLVESEAISNLVPPPPPPPPPPPLSPPPPPPLTPLISPPPPPALAMPPPPPPRILRVETPPPKKIGHPPNPPPPPHKKPLLPQHSLHTYHKHKTPPSKEKLNLGKKVGLLFTGIIAILQVCVVAFLVIKSRQMFKEQDVH